MKYGMKSKKQNQFKIPQKLQPPVDHQPRYKSLLNFRQRVTLLLHENEQNSGISIRWVAEQICSQKLNLFAPIQFISILHVIFDSIFPICTFRNEISSLPKSKEFRVRLYSLIHFPSTYDSVYVFDEFEKNTFLREKIADANGKKALPG